MRKRKIAPWSTFKALLTSLGGEWERRNATFGNFLYKWCATAMLARSMNSSINLTKIRFLDKKTHNLLQARTKTQLHNQVRDHFKDAPKQRNYSRCVVTPALQNKEKRCICAVFATTFKLVTESGIFTSWLPPDTNSTLDGWIFKTQGNITHRHRRLGQEQTSPTKVYPECVAPISWTDMEQRAQKH